MRGSNVNTGVIQEEIEVFPKDTNLHLPSNSRLVSMSLKQASKGRKPTVFLDRDGVIIKDVNFLTSAEQIEILPGAAEAIEELQRFFYIVVVTNQSGLARGYLSAQTLLEIHTKLAGALNEQGVVIDAFYFCPHLPEGKVFDFAQDCDCRKPKPGLLNRAGADWGIEICQSFLVGDSPRDVQAGLVAGARCIQTGEAHGLPDGVGAAADLLEASRLILGWTGLSDRTR